MSLEQPGDVARLPTETHLVFPFVTLVERRGDFSKERLRLLSCRGGGVYINLHASEFGMLKADYVPTPIMLFRAGSRTGRR